MENEAALQRLDEHEGVGEQANRKLTISHKILMGITSEMLHGVVNMTNPPMQHLGGVHPSYRVWHPLDHIHCNNLSYAPGGTGSAGTRRHIVEAFGVQERSLINIIDRVTHLDENGILLETKQAGISLGIGNLLIHVLLQLLSLEHQFIPTANGTRYESRLLIGMDSELGGLSVNSIVLLFFIGEEMARAWVKHKVEKLEILRNFYLSYS